MYGGPSILRGFVRDTLIVPERTHGLRLKDHTCGTGIQPREVRVLLTPKLKLFVNSGLSEKEYGVSLSSIQTAEIY